MSSGGRVEFSHQNGAKNWYADFFKDDKCTSLLSICKNMIWCI